jgi:hypothetical protein
VPYPDEDVEPKLVAGDNFYQNHYPKQRKTGDSLRLMTGSSPSLTPTKSVSSKKKGSISPTVGEKTTMAQRAANALSRGLTLNWFGQVVKPEPVVPRKIKYKDNANEDVIEHLREE